jgi:hypothetical protein
MPTHTASKPKDGEPVTKMLRLTMSNSEWRILRVWAAEDETSMQALVAQLTSNAITKRIRTTAAAKAVERDA